MKIAKGVQNIFFLSQGILYEKEESGKVESKICKTKTFVFRALEILDPVNFCRSFVIIMLYFVHSLMFYFRCCVKRHYNFKLLKTE